MSEIQIYTHNGYRIYVDVLAGENLSSIELAKMDLICWSFVHSEGEGDGVNRVNGEYNFLASCKHHFIRVYEYLVQHPNNNKSNIHTVRTRIIKIIIEVY